MGLLTFAVQQEISDFQEYERYRKRHFVKATIFFALPTICFFMVLAFKNHRYLTGCILLFMAFALSLVLFLTQKGIPLKSKSPVVDHLLKLFLFSFGIFLLYSIWRHGEIGKVPFYFIFPPLAFFLVSVRMGLFCSAVMLVSSVVLLFGFHQSPDQNYIHILRHLILFALLAIYSGVIIYSDRDATKKLFEKQAELKKSQHRLREANTLLKHEIGKRRSAEKKREASENRYRVLASSVTDGVCIIWNWKLSYANKPFAAILGRSLEEIVGKDFIALTPDNVKERYGRIAEKPFEEISGLTSQDLWVLEDGREVWIDAACNVVQWEGDQAVLITVRDITKKKLKEITDEKEKEALKIENSRLRSSFRERYKLGDIIGKSTAMQDVYENIMKASASNANVVILGESGTGKELAAKAIHQMSDRGDQAFVPVNCGAIPEKLAESEFFGYRKGAFTGAEMDKKGYLAIADGGTLFLDEVAELEPNMQVKLLRAIENGEYIPLGDTVLRKTDLRIISATNRDLSKMVAGGRMREDFYYRISVIPITLPPLRDRKEDIPLLIEYFLKRYSNGKKFTKFSGETMEVIYDYGWPGNVRELQSVIQRYLAYGNLLDFVKTKNKTGHGENGAEFRPHHAIVNLQEAMNHFEKQKISHTLEKYEWHRRETASALGIDPKTLYSKIKKYGLQSN
ncbi:MAG: sigma 54-interacting transcriptional regulator [Deltaproteobacteria bacterium]|nr:sigma 54-interacting transcriptional regulator [Deltaproteobacteria bacterium]